MCVWVFPYDKFQNGDTFFGGYMCILTCKSSVLKIILLWFGNQSNAFEIENEFILNSEIIHVNFILPAH